jgi:hypothetical protein
LDSIISHEPKPPLFTAQGLLDYIVELIVCEDEVCPPTSVLVISLQTEDLSRRFDSSDREVSGVLLNTANLVLWRKTSHIATPFAWKYYVVLTSQRILSERN